MPVLIITVQVWIFLIRVIACVPRFSKLKKRAFSIGLIVIASVAPQRLITGFIPRSV